MLIYNITFKTLKKYNISYKYGKVDIMAGMWLKYSWLKFIDML
jgi:hypothetical protein